MSTNKDKYVGLPPLPPDFVKEYPPVARIIEPLCIACDRCVPLCFFEALMMEDRAGHKYGRVAVVIEENCTGCGLCFEGCPVEAIEWIPDKEDPKRR